MTVKPLGIVMRADPRGWLLGAPVRSASVIVYVQLPDAPGANVAGGEMVAVNGLALTATPAAARTAAKTMAAAAAPTSPKEKRAPRARHRRNPTAQAGELPNVNPLARRPASSRCGTDTTRANGPRSPGRESKRRKDGDEAGKTCETGRCGVTLVGDGLEARAASLRAPRTHDVERRSLSVRELVDLYGRAGFDVLAVTDHTAARRLRPGGRLRRLSRRGRGRGGAGAAPLRPARHPRPRADATTTRTPRRPVTRSRSASPLRRRRRRARASFARSSRARGGARRRPPVSRSRTPRLDPRHGGVRGRPGALGAARRPVRALQPRDAVRAGSPTPACRRSRTATSTCPSTSAAGRRCCRAREGRAGGRRLPPLAAAGVPRAPPVAGRASAARRLSGMWRGGDGPESNSRPAAEWG